MGRSKAVAVAATKERPHGPVVIDRAVAALLDHIAEELAREYVRLVEQAAVRADGADQPRGPAEEGA